MKNLITSTACVLLLMTFVMQFVHQQVLYQKMVIVNDIVDRYQENLDEDWLKKEVSHVMGCGMDAVELEKTEAQYTVRFPMGGIIASPGFWGIDGEENVKTAVISRNWKEKEGEEHHE